MPSFAKEKELVAKWFELWEKGEFMELPLTPDFKHNSPFGTIEGKNEYINLVSRNKKKFLGHRFLLHDELYGTGHACVRYTAIQQDFRLDVSEWYYFKNELISEIFSYYHIGEIRDDRKLQ